MVPLIILIVVILLLRAIATSKTAANVPMQTKTVCSTPTAGDSFTQGNTIAAGVPEPPVLFHETLPPPPLHCQHIVVGGAPKVYCGLPAHVVYPIAPPPVKITNPAPILSYPKPAPMPVAPIARPIPTPIPRPPQPISPKIYFMASPSPSHCLISPTCYPTGRAISPCNFCSHAGGVGLGCVETCTYGTVG